MLPFTGHEPTVTRNRRRRVAIAIGLSLAVHLVALVLFLAVGVGPGGDGGTGEPGPGDYVLVAEPDRWMGAESAEAVAPPPSDTQPALSSPRAGGGGATSSSPSGDRRRPGPRRSRANPSPSVPGAPPSTQPPSGRPQPPPIPRADPAAEAARKAFLADLRRRLKENWRPYEIYRRVDPQGRLRGSLLTSVVQVRLGADGKLERSTLASSSGVEGLDQQALAVVAQAKLRPVPPHMLDDKGGLTVNCKLALDVGMFLFAANIRTAIEGLWRPSRAFATTADERERTTVLQLLLARDGKLLETRVVSSAGIDFLDENPRKSLEPGTAFPVPPPAFTRNPGPAQVFVAFLHRAARVRVLEPTEDTDEE